MRRRIYQCSRCIIHDRTGGETTQMFASPDKWIKKMHVYSSIRTYVCVCSQSLSCVQLCDPMDYNSLGSPVHENFQARILEQVAISFSRGSSRPRA